MIKNIPMKVLNLFNSPDGDSRQNGTIPGIAKQVHGSWTPRSAAILVLKALLLVSLCLFAASTHLTNLRITLFGSTSLILLILWRLSGEGAGGRSIPRSVIILFLLFYCSLYASYLISQNRGYGYFEYKHIKYVLVGGLLYATVLPNRFREIIIIVLFSSAALDGLIGVLQYFNFVRSGESLSYLAQLLGFINYDTSRPSGLTLIATTYAAKLAFVLGCALLLLFHDNRMFLNTKAGSLFFLTVILLTSGGMIVSNSRGPLLSFVLSAVITLFYYNWKKALLFSTALTIIFIIVLSNNGSVRKRILMPDVFGTIADPMSSEGNRLELWKGSLILFLKTPAFGIGAGDFEKNIIQLVNDKNINKIPSISHAHNIFLHTLATQGLIGISMLIALLAALIHWGVQRINSDNGLGGYIIIFCTLLMITEGLTDYYLGATQYVSVIYLLIGLMSSFDNDVVLSC